MKRAANEKKKNNIPVPKIKRSTIKTIEKKTPFGSPKRNLVTKSERKNQKGESRILTAKNDLKKETVAPKKTIQKSTKNNAAVQNSNSSVRNKKPSVAGSNKSKTKITKSKQIVDKTAKSKTAIKGKNSKLESQKKTTSSGKSRNLRKTRKPTVAGKKSTPPKTDKKASAKPKIERPKVTNKRTAPKRAKALKFLKTAVSNKIKPKKKPDLKITKPVAKIKDKKTAAIAITNKKLPKRTTKKTSVLNSEIVGTKKKANTTLLTSKQTKTKPKSVKSNSAVKTVTKSVSKTQSVNSIPEQKPRKKPVRPISSAVFRGKKSQYNFRVFSIEEKFEPLQAVYIISRRITDKRKRGHHKLICIGQTDSVMEGIKMHKKGKCIGQNEANVICLLKEEDEKNRLRIEADLREAHSVICNRQ